MNEKSIRESLGSTLWHSSGSVNYPVHIYKDGFRGRLEGLQSFEVDGRYTFLISQLGRR